MPWSDDVKGVRIGSDGSINDVDCNIKTDALGNETDIIYHKTNQPHTPHDHAWNLNTKESGKRDSIDDWDK